VCFDKLFDIPKPKVPKTPAPAPTKSSAEIAAEAEAENRRRAYSTQGIRSLFSYGDLATGDEEDETPRVKRVVLGME
jgi:hypothetical protein